MGDIIDTSATMFRNFIEITNTLKGGVLVLMILLLDPDESMTQL